MKIGDEVRVRNDSLAYGGAFHGRFGVVKSYYHYGGGVGVKLSNLVNERSANGLYYFNERELFVVGTDVDSSFINGLSNTSKRYTNPFSIKDVIFNDPAVIVLWNDGSKTVVKCSDKDGFDPEKGLAMAISKKALGNKGNYYNTFKKYLPKYEEAEEVESDFLREFWRSMCTNLYR